MGRGQPLESRLESAGSLVRGEARQRPSADRSRGDSPLVLDAGREPVVRELAEPRFAPGASSASAIRRCRARAGGSSSLASDRQQRMREREALAAELGDEPGGPASDSTASTSSSLRRPTCASTSTSNSRPITAAMRSRRVPRRRASRPAGDDVAHHLRQLHRASDCVSSQPSAGDDRAGLAQVAQDLHEVERVAAGLARRARRRRSAPRRSAAVRQPSRTTCSRSPGHPRAPAAVRRARATGP